MKSNLGRIVIFAPVLFFVFSAFMLPQKSPAGNRAALLTLEIQAQS